MSRRLEAETRIRQVIYDEVSTSAGHAHHGRNCNCDRIAASIMQRLRSDLAPLVEAWLWFGSERPQMAEVRWAGGATRSSCSMTRGRIPEGQVNDE